MRKFEKWFLISCGILTPILLGLALLAGLGEAMVSFSPARKVEPDGIHGMIAWLYRYPLPARGTIVYMMNGICWSLALSALIAVIGSGKLWGRRSDV